MPAKMVSTLTDENRDLRKQIGCMNRIFRLFNSRHFLTGRIMSSHKQNRLLLLGAQQQLEPHNATEAIIEKGLEAPKEKIRAFSESSQASTSSSLSPNCNRHISTSESRFQITSMKEQRHSSSKSQQSPDIRDAVKDSMYREARGVPIKSFANAEREVTVKHIDSPRPLQQSKLRMPKATVYEGAKSSKDERLALPRFSYDGRDSRDVFKTNMKLKELPRISLDSKASPKKCSSLESRLNILGCESGNHSRSNSIVAKLMGMDAFPDSITTYESSITKIKSSESPRPSQRLAFLSELSTIAEGRKNKQVSSSPPVSQGKPASPSPRSHNTNSIRKTTMCSRLPIEPAPWKQQDCNQRSPKMATQSGKALKNSPRTSSVYGEIEKRISEIEFKKSGKDLRALKQIIEAMQKTKESLENQRGESAELKILERSSLEDSWFDQNYNFSNIEAFKSSSSNQITRYETMHLRRIQTQGCKYHRENQAHKEKAKYCSLRNNNVKEANQRLPSLGKKITWRNLELEQTLKAPQYKRVENCTTSERDSRMVSPRVQHTVLKTERESHPKSSTSEYGRVKKQPTKKAREKCPESRKHRMTSTDMQLSGDQLSNLSSETGYLSCHSDTASTKSESNNSIASHIETDIISSNSREQQDYLKKAQKPAIELAVIMMEQPSPVSVLETPFYSEGSPSPVKKISTVFRDESPSPDGMEWHLENLNHLTDYRKSDSDYEFNQKSDNLFHIVREPRLLKTKAYGTAADHNESAYQSINPGHKWLTEILLASPLLNDASIIQTADQLLSPCHLINPDMCHALEEKDDPTEEAVGQLTEKNDQMKLNQKIQRKFVSDMVNEILSRKTFSGGLYTMGRKRMSLQGLIKEVYLEMDHLCRMPYCNLDEEDDGSIRLLTADIKYQSDDWTDYSSEVPALVLDIERLIFKELIDEIVTRAVVLGFQDWPKRHCRKLFTKKYFNLPL